MSSPKKLRSDSEESAKSSSCSELLQDIYFTKKSRWTDIQFKVEDKNLYIPKSHLAMVSPVFRLMFESDFKEKDTDVLPLPGKKYEDVLLFLQCTHPGTRLKVTYDIVPKVLPLAHEYQVKWLLDDCTNIMIMVIDASECAKTLPMNVFLVEKCCNICILAEQYGLSSVIEKFIEKFSTVCYQDYKDVSEFNRISIGVRYRIVCTRLNSRDPGDPVFYML